MEELEDVNLELDVALWVVIIEVYMCQNHFDVPLDVIDFAYR